MKPAEDFWEQTRGIIHANYLNVDDILVVINGDGAEWIRQGATFFAKGMYQYNRFHIARELRTGLQSNTKALRKAQKALKENNVGNLLYVVTEAWVTCTDEEEK